MSFTFSESAIQPSSCVRNLGVSIDCALSLNQHVGRLISSMSLELRRINKIRHLVSKPVTEILVNSLVLSKLDYCNSLLANTSRENLRRLQIVQNNAARLVFRKKRFDSATPLLRALHWLPVEKRIVYKTCTTVYKALNNLAPTYIFNILELYVPRRSLRSSSDTTLLVKFPAVRKIGEKSFKFFAPICWNSLPSAIRSSDSITHFKSSLKTFLF